jgi:phosphatidylserine decarboxylase
MDSKIKFWNPFTKSLDIEKVYGERWLKFTYNNPFGRIGLWGMVKRGWFSSWYGSKMNAPKSASKIAPFIEKYRLDKEEFLEPPHSFNSFNQFFFRKLKPNARPISKDSNSIVFPADGRHLVLPDLSRTKNIYAKGQKFCLSTLLGDLSLAEKFKNGSMVISRLCPVDYHRFHVPCAGTIKSRTLINGFLYSVNPIALRKKISVFWENKRYLTILQNEKVGDVLQLMVGATCVGSVHWTSKIGDHLQMGNEQGYFSFGGSCVITIFPSSSIKFRADLCEKSSEGFETYGLMGEMMAKYSF